MPAYLLITLSGALLAKAAEKFPQAYSHLRGSGGSGKAILQLFRNRDSKFLGVGCGREHCAWQPTTHMHRSIKLSGPRTESTWNFPIIL